MKINKRHEINFGFKSKEKFSHLINKEIMNNKDSTREEN